MNQKRWFSLTSAIGGFYLLLTGLISGTGAIASAVFFWGEPNAPDSSAGLMAQLVITIVLLTAGFLLIRQRDRFTDWLFGKDEGGALEVARSSRFAIESLAFALLGLWFALHALPGLLGSLVHLLKTWLLSNAGHVDPSVEWGRNQPWSDFFQTLIQFALGAWLFLRSEGLTLLWRRMRGYSVHEVPDEPSKGNEPIA